MRRYHVYHCQLYFQYPSFVQVYVGEVLKTVSVLSLPSLVGHLHGETSALQEHLVRCNISGMSCKSWNDGVMNIGCRYSV